MGKEIKLSLVYRDMWQSAGKYMPTVKELEKVAEPIIEIGCFDRVETNGGGFEQIYLLMGENPNTAVRRWTAPFNKAGIQTHMLERGLNGIRLSPAPRDVRKLMFDVKKKQGTDISRSFDGLNNPQNLALSFQYAREGGMIAQGAISITHSPVHTVEYYIDLADKFMDLGSEEICIKDMAGIGRPVSIGKITKGIRERHPDIILSYHGHATPGFSIVSSLEAARNGADYIDVGMEPLSWGTGHADLLSVHEMLKDAGFRLKDINYDAYMEVRALTKSYIDEWLGYFINPQNRFMSSLLIRPGLPGGMMGSLMSDLEKNLGSINKWLVKNNRNKMSQDELLLRLFDEVEYTWPKLGYPPLVTPYSQYVKNLALMNVIQTIKGKGRFSMIDENTWGMILGKSGSLPAEPDPALVELAKEQGREFFNGDPQDLYPDALDEYREKMKEKGWDTGQDDEELFEYAMHPEQYEEYKSGHARESFLNELENKRTKAESPAITKIKQNGQPSMPKSLVIEVEGEKFQVKVDYPETESGKEGSSGPEPRNEEVKYISSPLEGKFFLTKDSNDKPIKVGDKVNVGDTVAFVESMKVINAISSPESGVVKEILVNHGDDIEEDSKLIKLV